MSLLAFVMWLVMMQQENNGTTARRLKVKPCHLHGRGRVRS